MLDETELETIPSVKVDNPPPGTIIVRDLGPSSQLNDNGSHTQPVIDPARDMEIFIHDAEEMTTGEGKRYGDMTADALRGMQTAISKKLAGELTPEKRTEYIAKQKALGILIPVVEEHEAKQTQPS
jgi:hypothetical protein